MSSETAISIRGLSKAYTIAHNAPRRQMFGEALMSRLRQPFRKPQSETFWALKDLSFEVKKGEVVGIIGRNGAGKSTLLKILSRITEPTSGRVELFGRVGSLLEVGTGFHAELTGRENIFLNGAILGMRRKEIERQFDAIVDFAEVEKFLDTPVKRYSSGMYVRLAFAVAAHLNPEILIVDEVLAVGDAEFQKKCLGKMHDVAEQQGRTVLFVSHNMQAVASLCSKVCLLSGGSLIEQGNTDGVLTRYLSMAADMGTSKEWPPDNAPGDSSLRLRAMRLKNGSRENVPHFGSADDILIEMEFHADCDPKSLCVGFDLITIDGVTVLRSYQTDMREADRPIFTRGSNKWICRIPGGNLNGGSYSVCPRIGMHNQNWIVHLDGQITLDITLNHGVSAFWAALDHRSRPGVIAPIFSWTGMAV